MIRWLLPEAKAGVEIWGTDIGSSRMVWCKQYLSPPFHFATTTIYPHLPFPDEYFGLIYAGSVFTHIDDLADAWLLELRRVIRPGGRLYMTIHDRHSLELFSTKMRDHPMAKALYDSPMTAEFCRSDFGMFTLQRGPESQVFYDADWLCEQLEPFWRRKSVTEEAYGYQTAVLLERV